MPITKSRYRATVATALLLGAHSPAAAQTTQDRNAGRRPPNGMAAFLPFSPGSKWNWSFKVDDRKPVAMEWHCVRQVNIHKRRHAGLDDEIDQSAEELCWELRTLRGTRRSWEYWAARKDGIYRFKNRYLGNLRGVTDREPTKLIPGPLGIETRWRWKEIGAVQTEGSAGYPSDKELEMSYEGRIESMSEQVTVPAGTFDALRVKISMRSEMFGNTDETMWLARGTGIVKRVVEQNDGVIRHVYELRSFSRGTEVRGSTREQIQELLVADEACARLGKPVSLTPINDNTLETQLGSRFFAARWKNAAVFFRHFAGRTTIFHPGTKTSWNRLLVEEFGELQRTDAMAAAKAFGVLWALYHSPRTRPVPRGSEMNTHRGGNFDVKAWVQRNAADNKRVRGYARMWFEGGKLVRMESDLVGHAATKK